jgi:hypothetical protein
MIEPPAVTGRAAVHLDAVVLLLRDEIGMATGTLHRGLLSIEEDDTSPG